MTQQTRRETDMAPTTAGICDRVICQVTLPAAPMPQWLLPDLIGEQIRHNLEVARVLRRDIVWGHILRAQGDLLWASFNHWARLGIGWLEIVQSTMTVPRASQQSGKTI